MNSVQNTQSGAIRGYRRGIVIQRRAIPSPRDVNAKVTEFLPWNLKSSNSLTSNPPTFLQPAQMRIQLALHLPIQIKDPGRPILH